MKIYLQVLTLSIKLQIWLFHVVELLMTAKKWTNIKKRMFLFLPITFIYRFVTFSLPSSLLKLPTYSPTKSQLENFFDVIWTLVADNATNTVPCAK